MIDAEGLIHRHGGAQESLTFQDCRVPSGGLVLLTGPSGSGKSTLLALLAGLLAVQQGRLSVAGADLHRMDAKARDAWRGRVVGVQPLRQHLSAGLSVIDNLALAYTAVGVAVDHASLEQVLEQLSIGSLRHRRPHELSGGQALRVALARAVLRRPQVLLVDEPTAHLDDHSTAEALALLAMAAADARATLVIATHDARVRTAWPQAQPWRLQRTLERGPA